MPTTRTRHTAEERREELLEAAVEEFAAHGYHGGSTDAIARRAGISQPYLFRLFGSKHELYVACVRRCFLRTLETFQRAAEGLRGKQALAAIGAAYGELLAEDASMLRGQLHSYAAAVGDPLVADAVRDGFGDLYAYVARVSGASRSEVASFFAQGMLLNVAAAMGARPGETAADPWLRELLAGCREL